VFQCCSKVLVTLPASYKMEVRCLRDIICTLQPPGSVSTQRIELHRDFVLSDALREERKAKFDPLRLLKVHTVFLSEQERITALCSYFFLIYM